MTVDDVDRSLVEKVIPYRVQIAIHFTQTAMMTLALWALAAVLTGTVVWNYLVGSLEQSLCSEINE